MTSFAMMEPLCVFSVTKTKSQLVPIEGQTIITFLFEGRVLAEHVERQRVLSVASSDANPGLAGERTIHLALMNLIASSTSSTGTSGRTGPNSSLSSVSTQCAS
jgi:hypothetical protein